ncbi:hypothetical protein GCM10023167_06730 [Brevibacterium pityocampae]|uniref:Uncharacterized protein n=1 Tax=Brevibacterium pityocampae TaxID=506594 RepID=A0ABP8J553_9MICO
MRMDVASEPDEGVEVGSQGGSDHAHSVFRMDDERTDGTGDIAVDDGVIPDSSPDDERT